MSPADEPLRKPGRPRDPDREARRKTEILACAAREFAQAGYANTDVDAIAAAVGVGKGTIYRYFPTKQELFLAAVDAGLTELDVALDAIVDDSSRTLHDRFAAVILEYLQFFHRRPEMAELFIQERATFRERHTPSYFAQEADCDSIRFVEQLMATGVIRTMPITQFMDVLGNLLYGTIMTNHLAGKRANPTEQAAALWDVILHGVSPTPIQPTPRHTTHTPHSEQS
jgi:AcrR family transcriptional regulator